MGSPVNSRIFTAESSRWRPQGNRALVFSQYTSPDFGVAAMSEVLREFDPLTFTGANTMEERRDIIRRFRTDDRHKALIVFPAGRRRGSEPPGSLLRLSPGPLVEPGSGAAG